MSYDVMAQEIMSQIGGVSNVANLTHCVTRLRFNLKDESKVNDEAVQKIKGVMGVVRSGGQYQVIIGNSVGQVCAALNKLGSFSAGAGKASKTPKTPQNAFSAVCETIAGIFTPALPAITAAGMLQAVLVLLTAFSLVDGKGSTYYVFSKIANAGFYFIPVMLAYTAAKKFNCNPFMAVMLAGVLLHPELSKAAYEKDYGTLTLLGLTIKSVAYASSVIPIILGVWFMSYVEQFSEKVSPNAIKFFVKPLITIIIVAPITLLFIGPIGAVIGDYVATSITFLNTNVGWLATGLLGFFMAPIIMTGMHYALFPILFATFAAFGSESLIMSAMLASNLAQGGAALAVALKTRNSDFKALASSAGFTAVLGITEPAMYGVNIRLKKPFIAAMTGGGIGGLFAGIMGLKAFAPAPPGLAAIIIFLGGEGMFNFYMAIATVVIGFSVAFALTWFLGFEDVAKENQEDKVSSAEATIVS